MRRALLFVALLSCSAALAQAKHGGTSSAGITIASGIGSSPAAAGMSLSSGTLTLQPADATHPGVVTTGAQTFAGTKTLTGDVVMSASKIKGTFTTPQYIDLNSGSNGIRFATGSVNGGDFNFTDSGNNFVLHANSTKLNAFSNECPVPVVHAAQAGLGTAVAIEFGTATLTAGAGSATFATAFSAAPKCVCTDATSAAATQCSTSTTTLTIAGTSTDSVAWFCIGAK